MAFSALDKAVCLNCCCSFYRINTGTLFCVDCLNKLSYLLPPKPIKEEVRDCITCGFFFKTLTKKNYCESCIILSNKIFIKRKIISDPFHIGTEGPTPKLTVDVKDIVLINSLCHPTMALDIKYVNKSESKNIVYRLPLPKAFKFCDFTDDGDLIFNVRVLIKLKLLQPPFDTDCKIIKSGRLINSDKKTLEKLWDETSV